MWESRSDFQVMWKTWEACFWLSAISISRHFHGLLRLRPAATPRRRLFGRKLVGPAIEPPDEQWAVVDLEELFLGL